MIRKCQIVQQNNENMSESLNMQVGDDAVPLCPNCLEPCDPLANYCPHCGSNEAINPLASYMPFVDLRLRIGMIGKLMRKTWDSATPGGRRILYGAVFFVTTPIFFLFSLPFMVIGKLRSRKR